MECPVCLQDWHPEKRVPRSLQCGHSFCEECLKNIYVKHITMLPCPTCGFEHKVGANKDIFSILPKNFSLLALLSEKVDTKTFHPPINPIEEAEKTLAITKGNCEKHKLKAHSYSTTGALLCDKCILELPKGTMFQVLPSVVKTCKQLIEQSLKQTRAKQCEFKRYKVLMDQICTRNCLDIDNQIALHFQKIRRLIDEGEQLMKKKYNTFCSQQQSVVTKYLDELDNATISLQKIEEEINIILGQSEEHFSKLPEVSDINEMFIKLKLDTSIYDKLSNQLCSDFQFILSPLIIGNKPISFLSFAKPGKEWICQFCGSQVDSSMMECTKCNTFRTLETYPNLLYNANEVTEEEAKHISERRVLEKKIICGRDVITEDVFHTDTRYFLIHTQWMKQWKNFIFDKPSKESISCPGVGVLPPGPISNHLLLKDHIPIPNLVISTHYRGVNEFVWEAYQRIYGGGPPIVRSSMDIYSKPLSSELSYPDPRFYYNLESEQKSLIEKQKRKREREKEKEKIKNKAHPDK